MGFIEISDAAYKIPGGRVLFEGISARVGNTEHVALVGTNGTGKTTLLRLIAGIEKPSAGQVRVEGRVAYMPQFFGAVTVRELFIELSSDRIRHAALALVGAERAVASASNPGAHVAYADALTSWGEAGGYESEVLWDICTNAATGLSYGTVADRRLTTFSGGQQKRIALEFLLRSDADVLLLDEPDNFLDIAGKVWLEDALNASRKTIFYVSHDRTLLAETSRAVVTIEAHGAWTHHASFGTYQAAREHRIDKIDEEHRRYRERRQQLYESMKEMKRRAALNSKFASRAQSAATKLKRFETERAPREKTREQKIRMQLSGGRTGKIAFRAEGLTMPGIFDAFDAELYYGERIGVVGPNGSGKSHFLRLLAGEPLEHEGDWMLGARVAPSLFSQTHDRPELAGRAILDILMAKGIQRGPAMSGLKRYELHGAATTPFDLLSGGQQARFQILLMEHASPTMLLLDEPTDNLDIDSAEALEHGLDQFRGTVIAVTHDRWFMQTMDRFLVFEADGNVREATESPYI
ncbi:MAG: ABC-F family ATP-binding cassette domain-containing protein [Actinomycetota bacterium]